MITYRSEVTNMIRHAKVKKNISWAEVARAIGKSKEWTTAACLGQMVFTKEQAEKIGALLTSQRYRRLAADRALQRLLANHGVNRPFDLPLV
jgi:cyanate lyase